MTRKLSDDDLAGIAHCRARGVSAATTGRVYGVTKQRINQIWASATCRDRLLSLPTADEVETDDRPAPVSAPRRRALRREIGKDNAASRRVEARRDLLDGLLARAAADGAPCPSNDALAGALGARSDSTVSVDLAALEQEGRIVITRRANERAVEITATTACTALPPRSTDAPPRPADPAVASPAPATERASRLSLSDAGPARPPLGSLRPRDCRYPIGDPREPGFHFCGLPRDPDRPDSSYCAAHHAICWTVVPKRSARVEQLADWQARLARGPVRPHVDPGGGARDGPAAAE